MAQLSKQNYLKLDTIKDILTVGQYCPSAICEETAKVAVEDSSHYQVGKKTLERWKNSGYVWQTIAYIAQHGIEGIDMVTFQELMTSPKYAPIIIRTGKNLPLGIIDKLLQSYKSEIALAAAKWCEGKIIPDGMVDEWRHRDNLASRIAAIYATVGKALPADHPHVLADSEWIFAIMSNRVGADAVYKSFKRFPYPCNDILDVWYDNSYGKCKHAGPLIMKIAATKDDNVALIKKGLCSYDWGTQQAAAKALFGKELSLNTILDYLCSTRFTLRLAAMYASAGRKDVASRWIEDNFTAAKDIAAAARFAAHHSGLAPYRTTEPSGEVFKKCMGDIIVVAKIPKEAEIRGRKHDGQFRSDKAEIVDIIGDFYGDSIGISAYDKKTKYRTGDVVEIDDFDYSTETYAEGFHFFLTKEEAMSHKW